MLKRYTYGYFDRFQKVQVRVGDTDNRNVGLRQITTNKPCGGIQPAQKNHFVYHSFICPTLLSGKYLTIQSFQNNYFESTQIYVYTAGK